MKKIFLPLLSVCLCLFVQAQNDVDIQSGDLPHTGFEIPVEQELPSTDVTVSTPCNNFLVAFTCTWPLLDAQFHGFLESCVLYKGWMKTETLRLTTTVSNGTAPYRYKWRINGAPSNNTTPVMIVNVNDAKANGKLEYEVTITDASGCQEIWFFIPPIKDVRCLKKNGNEQDGKVVMCFFNGKKYKEHCIHTGDIEKKLKDGFTLGSCPAAQQQAPQADTNEKDTRTEVEMTTKLLLRVKPNPTQGAFTLTIESPNTKDAATLKVLDVTGKIIEQKILAANQNIQLGGSYKPGLYYAEVVQGREKASVKLIKQ